MKRVGLFILIGLLLVWLRTAFVAVDVAEYAYITRFGEPVVTYDGQEAAGLHLKAPWPVDSVVRLDRRIQTLDLPTVESLTIDPVTNTVDKTLAVDAYLTWRIADSAGADRFLKTLGNPEQVSRVVGPTVSGRLGALISRLPLTELIAPADEATQAARSERLQRALRGDGADDLARKFREDYGIELIEIRLRRLSYPEAVRNGIAERIRSERMRKVAEYESEGRLKAAEILSQADKDAKTTEANAKAEKLRLEGLAEVEADAIRNEAHAQDREFYQFLQKLKTYRALLSESKDWLLLSTRHPLFDLLLNPPTKPPLQPGAAPTPGSSPPPSSNP